MDRFIEQHRIFLKTLGNYLKSNMDRFIEKSCLYYELKHNNLKSNMDRFIECKIEINQCFV